MLIQFSESHQKQLYEKMLFDDPETAKNTNLKKKLSQLKGELTEIALK